VRDTEELKTWILLHEVNFILLYFYFILRSRRMNIFTPLMLFAHFFVMYELLTGKVRTELYNTSATYICQKYLLKTFIWRCFGLEENQSQKIKWATIGSVSSLDILDCVHRFLSRLQTTSIEKY